MDISIRQTLQVGALLFSSMLLASCDDPESVPPPPPPEPATQFPANISTIFTDNCINCHTNSNVGTFSLLPEENGWENAVAQAEAIASSVLGKRMPPFLADSGSCNTFVNEFPMSSSDIAAVTSWATPSGGFPTDTTGTVEMVLPTLEKLDPTDTSVITITMKEAYKPQGIGGQDAEDSRCFVIDGLAVDNIDVALTAFEVIASDNKTVHHVQLYSTNNSAGKAQALSEEIDDSISGFECYGGSGIAPANASLIANWTPGVGATYYPNNSGLRIFNDNVFIMKVHYLVKNSTAPSASITSMKLQLTELSVVAEAGIITFSDVPSAFNLTPNTADEIHKSVINIPRPYDATIYALMPHMHTLGSKITVRLNPGMVNETCLIDLPQWNYEWQQFFFYQTPSLVLQKNDVVEIECHYNTLDKNTATISGSAVDEEHCAAHFFVVPIASI